MTTDDHAQPTGERIKNARTARGWSQDDLADKLGVTQTAVSYWETGKRQLTIEALVHVAHALGVETAELLPESQPDPIGPPPDIDDYQHTGTPDLCCAHGEEVLGRLDRIIELLQMAAEARAKLTRGGYVKAPDDGMPLIGRTGCAVTGYCPTHDGKLIAIRDGHPKDVTEEAVDARMPGGSSKGDTQ